MLVSTFVDAASAPWVGVDLKGSNCSGGVQGFGPYDYTSSADKKMNIGGTDNPLNLVERAHFTPNVEGLIGGQSAAGALESDLDYTLRAWPNHHRALLSVIKYQLDVKNKLRKGKLLAPPECYLQRAIHFSPHDAVTYSLFGHYLRKMGHLEDAVKYYQKALELDRGNVKIAYSFSLLLIDLKRYEEAVKYAKIAYQTKGAPKALKQKLEKIGVWNEANPESSVDDGASNSTSDSE
ncbi:MAG: tetratricopeptide repeat protein [Mucilaginibacter sp.]